MANITMKHLNKFAQNDRASREAENGRARARFFAHVEIGANLF